MAVGAAAGGAAGALTDVGVDDNFMKNLGAQLQSGGAAIVVLVRQSTPDKVLPRVSQYGGEVIQSSLDNEAETRLQEALNANAASRLTAFPVPPAPPRPHAAGGAVQAFWRRACERRSSRTCIRATSRA